MRLLGESPASRGETLFGKKAGSSASHHNSPVFAGNSLSVTFGDKDPNLPAPTLPRSPARRCHPSRWRRLCLPGRLPLARAVCSVYLISAAWAGSHEEVDSPREQGPVLGSIQVFLAEPPTLWAPAFHVRPTWRNPSLPSVGSSHWSSLPRVWLYLGKRTEPGWRAAGAPAALRGLPAQAVPPQRLRTCPFLTQPCSLAAGIMG